MKKILTFTLALLILVSTSACGGGKSSGSSNADSSASGTVESKTSAAASANESQSQSSAPAEAAKLSGKLTLIQLDDRDASVLRGMRVSGNRIGSGEDINGKQASLTDVRCIFELNEWVDFYPDADAQTNLRVWALKHRDDRDYYTTCTFSEQMPDYAASSDLRAPAAEDDQDSSWGSFYLNPDDCAAGYYDLVFTNDGKAIATLLTRFYGENELSGKSGAELEKLMHE